MATQMRVVDNKGNRKFTQEQVFRLRESGLYTAQEGIVTVKEMDTFLQDKSNKLGEDEGYARRTGQVVFYRKGFQADLNKQIGNSIVYVENKVTHILEVPDVPVFDAMQNRTVNLQRATGMGVLNIEDLEMKVDVNENRVVSVKSGANPTAFVVDVMRPNGWALTDENGFPLRVQESTDKNPNSRYMYTRTNFEEGSDGYFASAVRVDGGRVVYAYDDWSNACGVAVTGLKEAALQKSVLLIADGYSSTEVRAKLAILTQDDGSLSDDKRELTRQHREFLASLRIK